MVGLYLAASRAVAWWVGIWLYLRLLHGGSRIKKFIRVAMDLRDSLVQFRGIGLPVPKYFRDSLVQFRGIGSPVRKYFRDSLVQFRGIGLPVPKYF